MTGEREASRHDTRRHKAEIRERSKDAGTHAHRANRGTHARKSQQKHRSNVRWNLDMRSGAGCRGTVL
jgi:hypothetical protein